MYVSAGSADVAIRSRGEDAQTLRYQFHQKAGNRGNRHRGTCSSLSIAAMPTKVDIVAMAALAMFIDEDEFMAAPIKRSHPAVRFYPHANVQELAVDITRRFLKNPEMAPIDAVKVQRAVDAVLSHRSNRSDPAKTSSGRCCDSKIAKLSAGPIPGLRLDHKIACGYGYAPFQSVGSKFEDDLRI